jgi:drug/metabolite transporter (DMT)-like permease
MRTYATSDRPSVRTIAAGVAGMTLVGGSVGVSHTLINAPLFTAQAIRYAVAAVVLVGIARVAHVRIVRPRGREWLWLAGISATGLVLFNVAIVRGVAHAEPAVIAVAVACVPILLGVIGPLLEHRAPRRQLLIAAAVVTAGATFVEGTGATDGVGVAWAALALACEAGFTLLAIPVLGRLGGWGVSVHAVWIGALMFTLLAGTTEGASAAGRLTASDLAAMTYLALLVTAAAFVLWYSAVAALGAAHAGLLTGVAPISAALTGMVTAGRTPGPLVWIGIAVVLSGLAAGLWGSQRSGASPETIDVTKEVTAAAVVAVSRLSE